MTEGFDIRSASTVVIADGETVVIGGLMEHDKTTVDTKIPILGDIRSSAPSSAPSEGPHEEGTPHFLTPHVVLQPSELASATRFGGPTRRKCPAARSRKQELNSVFDKNTIEKAGTIRETLIGACGRLNTPRPC